MLNFGNFEKGPGTVSRTHFVYDYSRKNIFHAIL